MGTPPYAETFYVGSTSDAQQRDLGYANCKPQVHKNVLLKSEYFEKALCGEFRESGTQSIDLPEENPAIFHFLIAYLYEGRYEPIKPAASVLSKLCLGPFANLTSSYSPAPQQSPTWTRAKATPQQTRAPSRTRTRHPPSSPT